MTRLDLLARLTRIEATRRLVLERAAALTPERLTARPGHDRWSSAYPARTLRVECPRLIQRVTEHGGR
jgi:hypothetical protein